MRGLQQARVSRGFVPDPMNLLRFITGDSANIYATFIQAVGLWMFGLLMVILARSVNRDWFEHFARGFIFLALAISSLRVAFALGPNYGRAFFFVYFLGEYLFLYFLLAGVRRLAGRASTERGGAMAGLGILAAAVLSYVPDFSTAFVVQAAIMALGLFAALGAVLRTPLALIPGLGLHLLRLSLFVLGVGFAQYVPVLLAVLMVGRELPELYAAFLPVFDLLFEAALAFAMIVTGMESVQGRLKATNASLEQARSKLDRMARTDPLTDLMNRHAFAAVIDGPAPTGIASGSIAVIDLDGLKAINDAHGHAVGDQAIRAFASALRARLRADDLIFRWGGDEFLAIVFGLSPAETCERLNEVGSVTFAADGVGDLAVRGSFGVAQFASIEELRSAAATADAAMYEAKRGRGRTLKRPDRAGQALDGRDLP